MASIIRLNSSSETFDPGGVPLGLISLFTGAPGALRGHALHRFSKSVCKEPSELADGLLPVFPLTAGSLGLYMQHPIAR